MPRSAPRFLVAAACLTAACLAAAPSPAADTHPFSIHDMLAMDRISDPAVSPDGKLVAFTSSATDLEANKRRTDVYLADVGGTWTRRLTTHEASDSGARWAPDGKSLYFLSTRSGSQQVWRLSLDGGEAEKVTDEPLDVENLEVGPGGRFLVYSMAVFPGASPAETKSRLDARRSPRPRVVSTTGSSSGTGTPGWTARAITCSFARCPPDLPAT